jgi:hypothetical protein
VHGREAVKRTGYAFLLSFQYDWALVQAASRKPLLALEQQQQQ